eukprot:CAMPEP_0117436736 /NCGR_PEP_ID=MMETSP0759-20121206/1161_1 /TAXON_ID=63605 /ORGANISM="Percolomonas cosmopolitus, Strain WS" /LENGTH=1347 /DNA_ID=CAMNT_0005228345 /DNA_START=310 /DNA_END=4353 /DNA_ORIENTATION=+
MQQELLSQDILIKKLKKSQQKKKKSSSRKKTSTQMTEEQLRMIQEYEERIHKLQNEVKHKAQLLLSAKQEGDQEEKQTLESRIPSWIVKKGQDFKRFVDLNWNCVVRDDLLILLRKILQRDGGGSARKKSGGPSGGKKKSSKLTSHSSSSSSSPILTISGVGKKSLLYSIMHDPTLLSFYHQQIIFNPFQHSLSVDVQQHFPFKEAMEQLLQVLSSLEHPTLILVHAPQYLDLGHFNTLHQLDWSIVAPGTSILLSVSDELAEDVSSQCVSIVQHISLTPMSKLKALRLINSFVPLHKENESMASDLIQRVHGNPFHLSLAGAMLRALPDKTPTLSETNVWKTVLDIWGAKNARNSLKSTIYELERSLTHDYLFEALLRSAVFSTHKFPLFVYALCLNCSLQYAYSVVEQLRERRLLTYNNGEVTIPDTIHRIVKEIITDDHDFGDFPTHHRRFCMILSQCCAGHGNMGTSHGSQDDVSLNGANQGVSTRHPLNTFSSTHSSILDVPSVDSALTYVEWTSFACPFFLPSSSKLTTQPDNALYEITDPDNQMRKTQKYYYRYLCMHLHEASLTHTRLQLIQSSQWFHNKIIQFPTQWRDYCLQDFMGEDPALFKLMVSLLSDCESECNIFAQPARLICTHVRNYFHNETNVSFFGDDLEGQTTSNTALYYEIGNKVENARYCTLQLVQTHVDVEESQLNGSMNDDVSATPASTVSTPHDVIVNGVGKIPATTTSTIPLYNPLSTAVPSLEENSQIAALTTLAGSVLICATQSGHILKYHINHPNKDGEFVIKYDTPVTVMITHKLSTLITGHEDGSVRVYSLDKRQQEEHFQVHKRSITALAITNDGCYVISAAEDDDNWIRMYDLNVGFEIKHFKGASARITSLYIDRNDKFFYSSSLDGHIRVYLLGASYKHNIEQEDVIMDPEVHISRGACNGLVYLGGMEYGGNYLVAAYDNGLLILYDLLRKQQVDWIRRHNSSINFLQLTGDQKYVCSSDWEGRIQMTQIVWQRENDSPNGDEQLNEGNFGSSTPSNAPPTSSYTPRFKQGYALKCEGGPVSALTTSTHGAVFVIGSQYEDTCPFPIMRLKNSAPLLETEQLFKTAFIVGNGNYIDTSFKRFPKSFNDANDVRELCLNEFEIAEKHIMFQMDVTAEKLLLLWREYRKMQSTLRRRFPQCVIVSFVYYSGHVDSTSIAQKNYLLPVDFKHFSSLSERHSESKTTKRVHLSTFAIDFEEILHRDAADSVVLIVDGSKSARMNPLDVAPLRSQFVAQSYDSSSEDANSAFTYYFLKHVRKENNLALGGIMTRVKDELYLDEESDQMPPPFKYSDDWIYNFAPNVKLEEGEGGLGW